MNDPAAAPKRSDEWSAGWRITLSAFFGMPIGSLAFFTQGVFMKPLSAEFGWTRTEIALAGLILSAVTATGLPLVGHFISMVGSRRLVLVGWMINMSAFAALGLIGDNLFVFYALWILVAMGIAMAGPVTLSAGVAGWFERHRGAAISIAVNGVNVVGVVAPLLATSLILNFGWRTAYIGLAGGAFVLCFPLLFLWFREKGVLSGGDQPAADASAGGGADLTRGEALRTREFWLFGIGILMAGGGLVAQVVHFVPALSDRGYSAGAAAAALSTNSFVAILCGACGGFLLDRWPLRRMGPLTCLFAIISSVILASGVGGMSGAVVAAACMGVTSGILVPMMSVFVSRYFGMRHYGAIMGLLMAFFSVSQGVGSVLVSAAHDAMGTYTLAFVALAVDLTIGALLMALVGRARSMVAMA